MKYSNEQVFQLFMEKLSGNISPEEEKALQQALSEDTVFRETWQSLEDQAVRIHAREFLDGLNADSGLDELKARIEVQTSPLLKRNFLLKRSLSIAALFLVMVTGVWLIFFRKPVILDKEKIAALVKKNQQSISLLLSNGQSVDLGKASRGQSIALGNTILNTAKGTLEYTSGDTAQSTLSVPAGGNYKIIISDGTEIWLNAASRLRFPLRFAATIREVFLDGEAYFKVAADARRPFIVHTPLTRVNVLGTAFNINTYEPGNVRTALVDGKVITEGDDGKSLVLSPGYAADYRAAQGFSSEKFEREDELAWINGVYYFHDMPIGDLARMASRCYGINIVLDKTKFAGRSLTGLLDRNKLSEFLNDLEVTAHIKYYYSGNDLYLE